MGAAHDLRSGEGGDEQLPRRFDRYDLLRKLATGGMAEIYLAKQSGLEGFEKVVVLKRILSHLATDEEFVSMFLDEARIAAKLSHPNIVQIYDLGKADNTYYIAMEYVSGRNVQHIIAKQQSRGEMVPVEHVCRVLAGVCDGLHYAHSRKDYDGTPLNIVHRDISPQNILVSFAGGVKVVDFGIAKASTQLAQTRAGVLKGKYAYMSPEQVRGAKVDHRSDLFAVGLVFYEMLTGTRAFERDSSLKTLKAIVQEKPLNPRELNPEVPMEVVKLLSKALEKNPDRRYKTAQEMQLAIEDYLESSPKKSNNVRLSRYMYDIFDDELNSADGTMIVKGIGEVIIPASQGMKAMPRIEEEIDHKTLSAALLPSPAGAKSAGKDGKGATNDDAIAPVATKAERSLSSPMAPRQSGPGAAAPKADAKPARAAVPTPPPAGVDDVSMEEDEDGKTMPAYDADNYERERAERLAAKGKAPPPDDDDDKTTAGVPPPSVKPAASPAGRRVDEGDARAAALLAKVDAMAAADAIPTKTTMPAYSPSGPRTDESPAQGSGGTLAMGSTPGGSSLDDGMAPKESMIVGPNGRVEAGAVRPPARAAAPTMPMVETETADTPPPGNPAVTQKAPRAPRRSAAPASPGGQAKLPPVFYAALIASCSLFALSLVGVIVIVFALAGSGAPDYGLVVVTTEPPGATVLVDNEPVGLSPAQATVPKDATFTVTVKLDGYEDPAPKQLSLEDKELLQPPAIILVKKQ